MPFPLSLTTSTLNECRIGWFDSGFWSPKPRDLLSSLIQHERLAPFFMTHKRSGIAVRCSDLLGYSLSSCILDFFLYCMAAAFSSATDLSTQRVLCHLV